MKKVKSFIFASILGLFNVSFGNINATFVDLPKKTGQIENNDLADCYKYADHLVDKMFFIRTTFHYRRSKLVGKYGNLIQKSVRFYLPIKYNSTGNMESSILCLPEFDGSNKFFDLARECAGTVMWVDDRRKMILS